MAAAVPRPHYLLYTESKARDNDGQWRFVVQGLDTAEQVEVADVETDVCGDRLELLTVIRGLESLDQPSRVTLVTSSRFVKQGIDEGLAEWRDNDWMWERFGELVPVKHVDLWRRLDHALSIHNVQCRRWRMDAAHAPAAQAPLAQKPSALANAAPAATPAAAAAAVKLPAAEAPAPQRAAACSLIETADAAASVPLEAQRAPRQKPAFWRRPLIRLERWMMEQAQGLRLRASQLGTSVLPAPWLE